MKKRFLSIALLIIIWQIVPIKLVALTDYFKDTVWMRQADQYQGFYMVKFSNNDSIIVAHGYEMDLFFNTYSGEEIKRIDGNNEVFFIKNDQNFIRLNQARTRFEIFDSKSFLVVDSLESDGIKILDYSSASISYDQMFLTAPISHGFRVWDLTTKRIIKTKIYPQEINLVYYEVTTVAFNCDRTKIIGHLIKTYQDPSHPGDSRYYTTYGNFTEYDFNSLEPQGNFINARYIILSSTCKYYAVSTNDPTYGVEIYDFNTKQLLQKLPLNGLNLTGIEFSPDDKYIVTSSEIKIWDLDSFKLVHYYQSGTANNFAISHNSKFIVSSTGNYLISWYGRFQTTPVVNISDTINLIYPNPSTGKVTIQFTQPDSEATSIILADMIGNPIQTLSNKFLESGNQSIELDVSSFSSGTYIIRVQNQHLSNIYKLIIIK
jgi:hypothetical protein